MFTDKYIIQYGPEHLHVGPQGVVQLAEGMYGGTYAIKFYCQPAIFENEQRIRRLPAVSGYFADVLHMGPSEGDLPSHRVSIRGQNLNAWMEERQRCTLLDAMRVLGQVSLRVEMLHATGTLTVGPLIIELRSAKKRVSTRGSRRSSCSPNEI